MFVSSYKCQRLGVWLIVGVGTLCIVAMMYLSLTFASRVLLDQDALQQPDRQYPHWLAMAPKLIFQWSWSHWLMAALYFVLMFGALSPPLLAICLGVLIGLAIFQLVDYTRVIADRQEYIWEQLHAAWQDTQAQSPRLIRTMENTWHCRGIDRLDHGSCYLVLYRQFAAQIFHWAVVVWCIKFLLIFGAFVYAAMFVRDDYLERGMFMNTIHL